MCACTPTHVHPRARVRKRVRTRAHGRRHTHTHTQVKEYQKSVDKGDGHFNIDGLMDVMVRSYKVYAANIRCPSVTSRY